VSILPAPNTSPTEPDRRPPSPSVTQQSGTQQSGTQQLRQVEPAASKAYRSQADRYDRRTEPFQVWRDQLVALLPARPGDTVLDVGCGTGLCLPLLQDKVGPTGTIVGIDASEQMLRVAGDRVAARGWDNVRLVAAPAESAPIDGPADAALFCAVHDVLQSPVALSRVFEQLRPGAAVAAGGGKWPGPWLRPLRRWVTAMHAPFVADFTGFDKPWRLLAEFVPDLRVHELSFGAGYLALGHCPSAPR
jgi:ubiquinone/menaquinone biosynthesis C-methylase UbiE